MELPTKHGWYLDRLDQVWRLNSGGWYSGSGWAEDDPTPWGPFVRLIPETEISTDEVIDLIQFTIAHACNEGCTVDEAEAILKLWQRTA